MFVVVMLVFVVVILLFVVVMLVFVVGEVGCNVGVCRLMENAVGW